MSSGKVSAICIASYVSSHVDNPKFIQTYKIIYTKSCQSQLIKFYKAQGHPIKIHLYKYGTRADADKIKEMLEPYKLHDLCELQENSGAASESKGLLKNTYSISLSSLLGCFMKHFEPGFDDGSDSDE